MDRQAYFDTLAAHWNGELVVCALGDTVEGWWQVSEISPADSPTFYHYAMGLASSFGIGLALSLPTCPVWVLDTDGGLTMNLGGLLTEAATQPANLLHVVLDNHGYQSLGGTPIVNQDRADYAAIARGAGIANVVAVSDAAGFADCLREHADGGRHGLVIADVEPPGDGDASGLDPGAPLPYEGPEIKYRFGRRIERVAGLNVFGPRGY
jgi:sulfopyruvate decarboxylase subunit beta